MATTFETWETIDAAFNNGTGHYFLIKDGRYIAVSENIPGIFETLLAQGFEWVDMKNGGKPKK